MLRLFERLVDTRHRGDVLVMYSKSVLCVFYLCRIMEGKTFKDIIRQKQHRLEDKINVDAGLLSKLEAYEIINRIQRTDLEVHVFLSVSFDIYSVSQKSSPL